jgi:hypothetical protein
MDNLTVCKIMLTLGKEIGQAFCEAEDLIKKQIKYNNNKE